MYFSGFDASPLPSAWFSLPNLPSISALLCTLTSEQDVQPFLLFLNRFYNVKNQTACLSFCNFPVKTVPFLNKRCSRQFLLLFGNGSSTVQYDYYRWIATIKSSLSFLELLTVLSFSSVTRYRAILGAAW